MDGYGYGEDLGGKRNTKPIPNISHRYYRISGIPIFPIGINMYRLSSHGRFIGFTGLNMKNWWEA